MGGIKQEQSDASQQPRPSHSADQPQEEVGTATSEQDQRDVLSFIKLPLGRIRLTSFATKDLIFLGSILTSDNYTPILLCS